MRGPVVAVVGGGVTGLAAALALAESGVPGRVVVLEGDRRLGGKVRTQVVDGQVIEAGPDAFLARVPEAVALCRRLGLGDELVAPATGRAYLWVGGELRALPAGTVLGVPTRLRPLLSSGMVSPAGVARASLDLVLPRRRFGGEGRPRPGADPAVAGSPFADPAVADPSVADLVRPRLGREVHELLVDPLVGGINAGRTDRLSAAAAAPQLDAGARRARSLMRGLRTPARADGGPVFLTHPEGLGRVVDKLSRTLADAGVELRTGSPVTALAAGTSGRWALASPAGTVDADAVLLAVPAFVAAGLVAPHSPEGARQLEQIRYASVSLVTLTYPAPAVPRALDGSGYLVPATEGRLTTACTWLTAKWPHLARPGQVLLRASTGRLGDDRHAALDDDALVHTVHRELVGAMGVLAPAPSRWAVHRWPSSFPQYEPGHLQRVQAAERALARVPGLVLAGAAYRGLGIPACIRQGQAAAGAIVASMGGRGTEAGAGPRATAPTPGAG